jgi:hypothetical protein
LNEFPDQRANVVVRVHEAEIGLDGQESPDGNEGVHDHDEIAERALLEDPVVAFVEEL